MKSYAGVTRADLEEQQTALKDASNLAIVTASSNEYEIEVASTRQPGHVQGAPAADRHDRAHLLARQHGRVRPARDLVARGGMTAPSSCSWASAAPRSELRERARLPAPTAGSRSLKPRSRCPGCGTTIRSYDNVPIVSWLQLRGRCRDCRVRISVRYRWSRRSRRHPVRGARVEVLAGRRPCGRRLRSRSRWSRRQPPTSRSASSPTPDAGAVLALVLWTVADLEPAAENVIAGVAAGGFLLIAALAYPAGMGMGDVKLAAVMGLFLGRSVGPALFIGFAAGAVAGMAIMAAARRRRASRGPLRPVPGARRHRPALRQRADRACAWTSQGFRPELFPSTTFS